MKKVGLSSVPCPHDNQISSLSQLTLFPLISYTINFNIFLCEIKKSRTVYQQQIYVTTESGMKNTCSKSILGQE